MKWNSALLAALLFCGLAAGQPAPGRALDAYSARALAGDVDIGAEFLYRTVPNGSQSIFVKDYVVVEVGLFGGGEERVPVSPGQFSLRVNGKKLALSPVNTEAVAYSQRWRVDPHLEAGVFAGDNGIVIGRPDSQSRFPGDVRNQPPPGRLPRVPDRAEAGGYEVESERDPADVLRSVALTAGESRLPVTGCLFFPYEKKMRSIKKLELIYQGAGGETSIRLK